MGILDDAIREHLDLKRRSGADPTEIERLEREALGPVRRVQEGGEQVFEAEQPAVSYAQDYPDAAPGHGTATQEEWELERDEELLPGESWATEPSVPDPMSEPQPPAPPAVSAPPSPDVVPPALEPEAGGETVEYDVEAAQESERHGTVPHAEPPHEPLAHADEPLEPPHDPPAHEHEPPTHEEAAHPEPQHPGEDVLEETPEFLQDTPDHDRLWFEQRPPRDFDFEG